MGMLYLVNWRQHHLQLNKVKLQPTTLERLLRIAVTLSADIQNSSNSNEFQGEAR